MPAAARLPNGYRDYGDKVLRVVNFVDRAQSLGFTLREVGAHLRSPRGDGRKARLQERLEAKLVELDASPGAGASAASYNFAADRRGAVRSRRRAKVHEG